MAGTPKYKIYNPNKEYVAACKHTEEAAMLAGALGEGTTIRYDHKVIVWTEGSEQQSASESYDFVADTIAERVATKVRPYDRRQ